MPFLPIRCFGERFPDELFNKEKAFKAHHRSFLLMRKMMSKLLLCVILQEILRVSWLYK